MVLLLWLVYSAAYTFLLNPLPGGFAIDTGKGFAVIDPLAGSGLMWFALATVPIIYFSIGCRRNLDLSAPICACAVVLMIYALGLCYQGFFLHGALTYYNGRESWPVRDPNNAACIINIGLVGFSGWYLTQRRVWTAIFIIPFILALVFTESSAGFVASIISMAFLVAVLYPRLRIIFISCAALILTLIVTTPYAKDAFASRFPIWLSTLRIIKDNPFGVGTGGFGDYYKNYRIEHETAGFFAHNDLLQIFAENGFIGAGLVASIILYIVFKTRRQNNVPACVMLAILMQAMVEFQFYVPAIAILLGLALTQWQLTKPNKASLI